MRTPWSIIGLLGQGATEYENGSIPLVRARTLTITARCDFSAGSIADTTMNLLYSPDGNNIDTVAYATIAIPFTAGATVQRTLLCDPPEHGYMMVQFVNTDAVGSVARLKVWYTIQSWDDIGADLNAIAASKALDKEKHEETGQP